MRIVVDLQACQFNSRFRGIGRYSFNLFTHMVRRARAHELIAVLSDREPGQLERLRVQLSDVLPPGNIRVFQSLNGTEGVIGTATSRARMREAEILRESFLSSLRPDVIHVASLFDGFGDSTVSTFSGHESLSGKTAVTLYDLIPLNRPDQYLADPVVSRWYHERISQLREVAQLLAISEHAKREATELLPYPEDRISNISSGVDPFFREVEVGLLERNSLLSKFGIRDRFVLYTGGYDSRKNLPALVEAWSRSDAKTSHQLVIAGYAPEPDIDAIRAKAAILGLGIEDVRCLGYVSDRELRLLYNLTDLYVFPSLYEGFGLPVLEAMACGAPAISSNYTSLPEVTGLPEAMFDPTDNQAIASKIDHVLGSADFAARLRAHARVQAGRFTWDAAAERALDALEELHERNCKTSTRSHTRPELALIARQASDFDDSQVRILEDKLERSYSVERVLPGDGEAQLRKISRRIYVADASIEDSVVFPLLQRYPGQVLLRDFWLPGTERGEAADPTRQYEAHGYAHLLQTLVQSSERDALPGSYPWLCEATGAMCLDPKVAALSDMWYGAQTSRDWCVLADRDNVYDNVERSFSHGARTLLERQMEAVSALGFDEMPPPDVDRFARAASANVIPSVGRRQLLVDVTELARTDAGTGIQRVVRNISRNLLQRRMSEFRVEPVVLDASGHYRYARAFSCRLLGIPQIDVADDFVEFSQGDIFLGLDLVPATALAMGAYHQMRSMGVALYFVVYDLLPILKPDCFPRGSVDAFTRWFDDIGRVAHGFIAISRAVAEEVFDELRALRLIDKNHLPQQIGYFHLGSNIDSSPTWTPSESDDLLLQEVEKGVSFLMVSTLEPRKAHLQVLEAFERWWEQDESCEARLIIVGKAGWLVEDLVARLEHHPELGKRLLWLRRVSDALLDSLYKKAAAVIVASLGEGFGLPLIEAAGHGTPVIARDLPVFREVAGAHAFYFSGERPGQLLQALREWMILRDEGRLPASHGMRRLTWQESTDELLQCIYGNVWHRDFVPDGDWIYPAHHRALGTLVGFRQNGMVWTLGRSGFLLFGPFGHLPGGRYRFQLRGVAGDVAGAKLEVVADRGKRMIAQIPWSERVEDDLLVDTVIELETDANEMEVRLQVFEETELGVSEYRFINLPYGASENPRASRNRDAKVTNALLLADDASSSEKPRPEFRLCGTDAKIFGGMRRVFPERHERFSQDDFHREHGDFEKLFYEIENTASAVSVLDALLRYGGHALIPVRSLESLVEHCPADLRVRLVWALEGHPGVCRLYDEPERFDTDLLLRCIHAVAESVTSASEMVRGLSALDEYAKNRSLPPERQRLLVDVSALAKHDARTGVQRVVRNVLRYLDETVHPGYLVTPVHFLEDGGFLYANRFATRLHGYPGDALGDEPVRLRPNDVFLGLDLSAHLIPFHREHFVTMREMGIPVTFVVQDMLPLRRPDFFSKPVTSVFRLWYAAIVDLADRLICISRATADQLLECCDQLRPERAKPLAIDYFHLGADLKDDIATGAEVSAPEKALLDKLGDRAFLAVSTIEPRKGHHQLLQAFDRLWDNDADVQLVLVGRQGWMVDDLIEHIRTHPLLNTRLFWFDSVSDAVLAELYGKAVALISASLGEGFGLPLIEAAHAKLPVLCRNLDVFHEVAGEYAFYFEGDAPEHLAEAVQQWLELRSQGSEPSSSGMPWLSWRQSTEALWGAMQGRCPYRSWTAGPRRYFPAYDSRLSSTAASLRDGQWVSSGEAGHLVYGPYVRVPAGFYRVIVHIDLAAGDTLRFEVSADMGRSILLEQMLQGEGIDAERGYAVEVLLPRDIDDLELRLLVGAGVECRFKAYELIRLGDSPDGVAVASSAAIV